MATASAQGGSRRQLAGDRVADGTDPVDVHVVDAQVLQLGAGLFDTLTTAQVNDAGRDRDAAAYGLGDVRPGRRVGSGPAGDPVVLGRIVAVVRGREVDPRTRSRLV
ncbi:hypothetical protein [Streptomyces yaizuensis]|uniref:Uncharacterized protein n=1 Tax=Streptomyces yaizuensis TaxID=2989713 RepID=A0ABQ5P649_9ACTN|nr:hypothetical protein [Streptomyces sp. YSPA8]GLF98068.1 hypothetical protein SYYSPA8_27245 [Streptomyces sp. YSPA8]